MIPLKEESQGCMVDRDVLFFLVIRNCNGKVQGVTVIPSPVVIIVVVDGKSQSIPRMFYNEKRAPVKQLQVT